MPKKSAGLLLFRRIDNASGFEVLLVHPGGPFWRNKDEGAWTIPKEEIGSAPPEGQYIPLTPIKQKNGKIVHAWAVEGDFDDSRLNSNEFETEWPPKSGRMQKFPEVDRAEWFAPDAAKRKMLASQAGLINELIS